MTGPPSPPGDGRGDTGEPGAARPAGVPPTRPATSALTVAQAAALRRLGLAPAGFVMGTVVMQVVSSVAGSAGFARPGLGGVYGGGYGPGGRGGYTAFPCAHMMGVGAEHWGFNAEDQGYAASVGAGYQLAVERLVEEARQRGAHGVVGVELSVGDLVGGYSTWTFRATGTAVALADRTPPAVPFVTNAGGQQIERLVALGMVPAALVTGVGACYVRPNCRTRGDYTVPGPVDQVPHALDVARGRARQALHDGAHRHGGDGVVHTWWSDRRLPSWGEGFIQTTVATGTVVRRFATVPVPAAPRPVVPLRP